MAMTVRELIRELMECDMDAPVELEIDFKNDNLTVTEFDVAQTYSGRYVELQVDLKDVKLHEDEDE